jgi:hypothetical protein
LYNDLNKKAGITKDTWDERKEKDTRKKETRRGGTRVWQ